MAQTISQGVIKDPRIAQALARVHTAMDRILWERPVYAPAFSRVRAQIEVDPACPTFAIGTSGKVKVNPDLALTLPIDQVGWIMIHEISHAILDHFARMPDGADPQIWNIAGDCVINSTIKADGGTLPEWVVYPPEGYTGPLQTEAIYTYLRRNPDQIPQGAKDGQGNPMPGAGCGMQPDDQGSDQAQGAEQGEGSQAGQAGQPSKGPAIDWGQVGDLMRGIAGVTNSGHGIADLITPGIAYLDFRKILRHGAQQATAKAGREDRTYSRMNRRAGDPRILTPGYQGADPRIAVVIDCSGSMDRSWIARISQEVIRMARDFSGLKIYLVTHTDRICWEGWITDKISVESIANATQFSGGTYADPAYDAIRKHGKFDSVVHFTDCELSSVWPTPPARRLIIGAFGQGAYNPYTPPPAGSTLIPCSEVA